jgi:predicted nucleic acid-binding protein
MEALACQEILTRAERSEVRLVWSFMHEDETILCPFPDRKYAVLQLARLCKVRVAPKEEIYNLAKSLQKRGGFSAKDAIHLACASSVDADFFLTCDDRLIRQVRPLDLELATMNPVDYIKET